MSGLVCAHCGTPAACVGSYEEGDGISAFGAACDECCAHGNEDGWCVPVSEAMDKLRTVLVGLQEQHDRLERLLPRLHEIGVNVYEPPIGGWAPGDPEPELHCRNERADAADATVDELRRSFDEATMLLSRLKLRQEAMGETSTLPLELPKGSYNILRSGLASGRAMSIVLPEGIAGADAAEIVKELEELAVVVAGMQPS